VPSFAAAASTPNAAHSLRMAVVIPSFRVTRHILDVLARIGSEIERIYVVDDACPEHTGDLVEEKCRDARVIVLRHGRNRGVGGAVKTGYAQGLADGFDVIIKVDGDGQMPPELIPALAKPIRLGLADYAKGNRFYSVEDVRAMPRARLFGNAALSFLTKLSSGYWRVFDPTNGFTAIHRSALELLPLEKISDGYFFESDMLFRLATVRAMVLDVPMKAIYNDERSALRIARILGPFVRGHLINFAKRVAYNYFLRDFSAASLQLVTGGASLLFATVFGSWHWMTSGAEHRFASAGTVMLAALPAILGVQLLLAFLSADIAAEPTIALQQLSD